MQLIDLVEAKKVGPIKKALSHVTHHFAKHKAGYKNLAKVGGGAAAGVGGTLGAMAVKKHMSKKEETVEAPSTEIHEKASRLSTLLGKLRKGVTKANAAKVGGGAAAGVGGTMGALALKKQMDKRKAQKMESEDMQETAFTKKLAVAGRNLGKSLQNQVVNAKTGKFRKRAVIGGTLGAVAGVNKLKDMAKKPETKKK